MIKLELNIKHPSTMLLTGPTSCVKNKFVRRFLDKRLIELFPTRLIWVLYESQEDYDKDKQYTIRLS